MALPSCLARSADLCHHGSRAGMSGVIAVTGVRLDDDHVHCVARDLRARLGRRARDHAHERGQRTTRQLWTIAGTRRPIGPAGRRRRFEREALEARRAEPPLSGLSFHQCAPQKVTAVPFALLPSPMTNGTRSSTTGTRTLSRRSIGRVGPGGAGRSSRRSRSVASSGLASWKRGFRGRAQPAASCSIVGEVAPEIRRQLRIVGLLEQRPDRAERTAIRPERD
jgi:hypothetical protein